MRLISHNWQAKVSLALMLAMLSTFPTHASQIAMGITNRGIFVQEYWDEGKPFYAIANLTGQQSHIALRASSDRDDGVHFTDHEYGATLLDFTATAGAVVFLETAVATNMNEPDGTRTIHSVDVLLNDKTVGCLSPRTSPRQTTVSKIMTDANMNYWGGGADGSVWFEQESMIWKGDHDITITLAIVTNSGDVGFGPYDQLGKFIASDPKMGSGNYTYDLPVPLLLPEKATCASLNVSENDGVYSVNSNAPSAERVNKVVLTFHTPRVTRATPVIVSGFRHRGPGSGAWVTRMLVVEP